MGMEWTEMVRAQTRFTRGKVRLKRSKNQSLFLAYLAINVQFQAFSRIYDD